MVLFRLLPDKFASPPPLKLVSTISLHKHQRFRTLQVIGVVSPLPIMFFLRLLSSDFAKRKAWKKHSLLRPLTRKRFFYIFPLFLVFLHFSPTIAEKCGLVPINLKHLFLNWPKQRKGNRKYSETLITITCSIPLYYHPLNKSLQIVKIYNSFFFLEIHFFRNSGPKEFFT